MSLENQIHVHDARSLSDLFSAKSTVDVTITSPPYWDQKNYGSSQQIGHGQTREEYLQSLQIILEQCLEITKDTGSLWLIIDDFWIKNILQLLPFDVAQCAQKAGWFLRDMIIWDKGHNLPYHTKGQMRHVSEFILVMTKTATSDFKYETSRIKTLDGLSKWWVDFPERFNPKGKTPTNIWHIPVRTQGTWRKPSALDHHCPFPTELVARIIDLTTDENDLVFDPFAGSGMVLAVAEAMGRRFMGCEVNADYVAMYEETVRKEVAGEWEELKAWQKKQNEARIDFEQTIMRLRALKYARQATRLLRKKLKEDDLEAIHSIVCTADIPEKYERGEKINVDISIVVRQIHEAHQDILPEIQERAENPPLTQYGIISNITLVTREKYVLHLNGQADRQYYLYPKDQPREFTKRDCIMSWMQSETLEEHAFLDRIPMLANVPVDVSWVLNE